MKEDKWLERVKPVLEPRCASVSDGHCGGGREQQGSCSSSCSMRSCFIHSVGKAETQVLKQKPEGHLVRAEGDASQPSCRSCMGGNC